MKLTRRAGGGRKAKAIENSIQPEEVDSAWLEDIILGVIRAQRADDVEYKNKKEVVNIITVKQIIDMLPVISTKDVMDEMRMSERQARLYVKVIELVIHFADLNRTKDYNAYYRKQVKDVSSEAMKDTYTDFQNRLTRSEKASQQLEKAFFNQRPVRDKPKPLDISNLLKQ